MKISISLKPAHFCDSRWSCSSSQMSLSPFHFSLHLLKCLAELFISSKCSFGIFFLFIHPHQLFIVLSFQPVLRLLCTLTNSDKLLHILLLINLSIDIQSFVLFLLSLHLTQPVFFLFMLSGFSFAVFMLSYFLW